MTQLLDKASRDALGIDTIARGIAYATLLLKSANYSKIELRTKEEFVNNSLKGTFLATITIDYVRTAFINSATNYLEGLLPIADSEQDELFSPLTPAGSGLPIPDDIPEVTNLESYLVWLLLEYYKAGLTLTTPDLTRVVITQGEDANRFYKKFAYFVNYSPIVYANTRNILEAIDSGSNLTPSTLFDNATIIDNSFFLVN